MTGPLWETLPDGWQIGQVKHTATVTLGKMLQSKDSGGDVDAPYMRAANVQPDGVLALDDVNEMWFGKVELEQLSIRAGDVVVVEGGQGGFGRAAYVDEDLLGWGFQNSINRLRPIGDFDGRFIAFYLIALRASGFIRAYANVVSMPHLTAEKLASIPIPLPPLEKQRAIADYLERETARIDTLIEEQQCLIEMLRERRHSVLAHALSGGGPRVPFVRCMTEQVDYRGATPRKADDGVQLVTARNVKSGWIDYETSQEFVDPAEYAEIMHRGLPRIGDLLFTMEAPLGNIAVVDREDIALAQRVIKWSADRSKAEPRFLMYAALGDDFQEQLLARATGSTALGVKASKLPELRIDLPSLEEQRGIIAYLDEQTAKIDPLIAETDRFIELARERRSALITAAVTGQIDVREMA